MCIMCERELWGEHRALEREFFKPCKTCNKFPGTSSEGTCYHCFAIGDTIDECPECAGKPWTEEFLEAKDEIEGPDSCWSRSRAGKRTSLRPWRITSRSVWFPLPDRNGDHGLATEISVGGRGLRSRYRWLESACPFALIRA